MTAGYSAQKRVALVTGSTQGLGLAIARVLARLGASVAICGTRPMRGITEIAKKLMMDSHAEIKGFRAELTGDSGVENLVESVQSQLGPIDVLVNCAGGFHVRRGTIDTTLGEWEQLISLNLTVPFRAIRSVLPHMLEQQWGRIINVGSETGRMPVAPNSVGYTAAKAGLLGLTKHVALETAASGITVNAINPGPMDTARFREIWENSEQGLAAHLATIPLGRAGVPEEVAELVAYLVSEAGAYATGSTFDINGGRLMW